VLDDNGVTRTVGALGIKANRVGAADGGRNRATELMAEEQGMMTVRSVSLPSSSPYNTVSESGERAKNEGPSRS
jgi:hypothetical protein